MLCRILRPEKVGGLRLRPGVLMELPEWVVRELEHRDPPIVDVLEQRRADNLDPIGRLANAQGTGRTFVKLPEGD